MELAQLQLIFNVVAITGATSLASFCYQLRKENRKLASRLPGEIRQNESQRTAPTANAVTSTEKDIRAFAAVRRTKWVEGMRLSVTLWSAHGK